MDKTIDTFTMSITLKINVMARLELKLAYYVVAVQDVSHSATGISYQHWKQWTAE